MATNASVGYVHDLSGDLRLDRRLVVNVSVLSEGYRLQAYKSWHRTHKFDTAWVILAILDPDVLAIGDTRV